MKEALKELLEAVEAAIQAGDWKVDGACDPDKAISRARKALAQPEQEPATYSAWGLMGGDEFVNKDSLNRSIT